MITKICGDRQLHMIIKSRFTRRLLPSLPFKRSFTTTSLALAFVVLLFHASATAQAPIDYDIDDDGLIGITTLEQLNAVRFDLLDSDGIPTSDAPAYREAFPNALVGMGCPDICGGYELLNDLDFDDAADYASGTVNTDWTSGSGWEPIGRFGITLASVFNGNGHTIYNLHINRSADFQGLFGTVGKDALITNVGVTGSVNAGGYSRVGGLVSGIDKSAIESSYSAVAVEGGAYSGSLLGFMTDSAAVASSVRRSYVTGSVYAGADSGGLLGQDFHSQAQGTIEHTYATGYVDLTRTGSHARGGGLIGNLGNMALRYSYATGLIHPGSQSGGGLGGVVDATHVAINVYAAATAVYWDSETSAKTNALGRGALAGISAKTTAELQAPTTYTGIYADWDAADAAGDATDYWDFGAANQYPALKIDFNNDDIASWQEFGYQLREGPTVTTTDTSVPGTLSWRAPDTSHWDDPPPVTYNIYRDGILLSLAADAITETVDADGEVTYSYADASLLPDTVYTYHIAAVVNGGEPSRSSPFVRRPEAKNMPDALTVVDSNAAANTIAENATSGTAVTGIALQAREGGLPLTDGAGLTWTLIDNAGGLFAIATDTGVVTAAGALNYEMAMRHTITAQASTGAVAGALTLAITVENVAESLTVADDDPSANRIAENSIAGTAVTGIALQAREGDLLLTGGKDFLWMLIDNANGLFKIATDTGVVTAAGALNYETAMRHTITAQASTGAVVSALTLAITVENVAESLTVADDDPSANRIAENSAAGTAVTGIALQAREGDLLLTGGKDFLWMLIDNAGGLFKIATDTGVVTAAGALDYETTMRHTITAQASTGAVVSALTLAITVENAPESLMIADDDPSANRIAENAVANMPVTGIALEARDEAGVAVSAVTWSVASASSDLFVINPDSGEVTVAGALDYETSMSHTIEVRGEADGMLPGALSLTITVTDFDETIIPPTVTDADPAVNTIAENSTDTAVAGIMLAVMRGGAQLSDITWILTDDADDLFVIATDTGVIKTATDRAPDYEAAVRHDVTAVAIASDGSIVALDLTIDVRNVPESLTIADNDPSANRIAENSAVGAAVTGIDLQAREDELLLADGAGFMWELTDTAGGLFAIATDTGVVTVAGALDYESTPTHSITARAVAGAVVSDALALMIAVLDAPDALTIADSDSSANRIAENSAVGAAVTGIALQARDEDDNEASGVTWSVTSASGDLFVINPDSGEVTVAGALDYESAPTHDVTVRAAAGTVVSDDLALTIRVLNVPETLIVANSGSGAEIAEDARVGTEVPGIALTAREGGVRLVGGKDFLWDLSYNAGGLFAIDPDSGAVTVAGALNFETAQTHTIIARASTGTVSGAIGLTIVVTDVDDVPPPQQVAYTATIAEDATTGTAVAGVTLTAQVAGGAAVGSAVRWYLADSNNPDLFAISRATGIITLAASDRLDYETAPRHRVMITAAADGYESVTEPLMIRVTNVLESLAIADSDAMTNTVAENAAVGTTVTGITLTVRDEANRAVNGVIWSVASTSSDLFVINPDSGEVTVAGALDYEASSNHLVIARAAKDAVVSNDLKLTIEVLNDPNDDDGAGPFEPALRLRLRLFLEGPLR